MMAPDTLHVLHAQATAAATRAGWVSLVAQCGVQYAWAPWNVLLSRSVAPTDRPMISYGATEAANAPTVGVMWGPVPFVHLPSERRRISAGAGAWPGDLAPGMFPPEGRPVVVLPVERLDPREVPVWLAAAEPDSPLETRLATAIDDAARDGESPAEVVAGAWSEFIPPSPSGLLGRTRRWPPAGIDELVCDSTEVWLQAAHGRPQSSLDALSHAAQRVFASLAEGDAAAVALYAAEQVTALGREALRQSGYPQFTGGTATVKTGGQPPPQPTPDRPVPLYWLGHLIGWYNAIHIERTGQVAACRVCDLDHDLTLLWAGPAEPWRITDPSSPQAAPWDELTALCHRCAAQLDQFLAQRTARGARWDGFPRFLLIPSAVGNLIRRNDPTLPDL